MSRTSKRLSRTAFLAAMGVLPFSPAAGAIIHMGADRPPVVVEHTAARSHRSDMTAHRGSAAPRSVERQAVKAYFDAGYDYDHAVDLAELWNYDNPYTAKITKGKYLLGIIDNLPSVTEVVDGDATDTTDANTTDVDTTDADTTNSDTTDSDTETDPALIHEIGC